MLRQLLVHDAAHQGSSTYHIRNLNHLQSHLDSHSIGIVLHRTNILVIFRRQVLIEFSHLLIAVHCNERGAMHVAGLDVSYLTKHS